MVAVVAIIGVVALVGAPRYASAAARYRLDASAYRLAADLRLAREYAINVGTPMTVSFAPGRLSSYTIRGMADRDDRSRTDTTVPLYLHPYGASFFAITAGGDNQIIFDGFGIPDSAGTFVLMGGERSRTVSVDGATGNVTVSP